MENATYKPLAPSQILRPRGEAAEPEYEIIPPHSSEPATDKLKQIPNPQQKGIVLPVIPFYVRNNAPDLQEFLIY